MHTPQDSFDFRVLRFGAIGICALLIAAFMSIATPKLIAAATPAYDEAGSTQWPMS